MNKTVISLSLICTLVLSACGGSSSGSSTSAIATPAPDTPTATEEQVPKLESYLWAFKAGSAIKSTAVLSDQNAYFGTDAGVIHAISREGGTEVWQQDIASRVSGGLLYVEGKVIALSSEGILYAFNAETGSIEWTLATAGESLSDQWDYHTNTPIYQDGSIYLASKSGVFYALNLADGTEKWSFNLNTKLRGTPLVVDNTLYISTNTSVLSINLSDGSENWYKASNMPTSPQITSGVLAVGSRDANVIGLNASSGEEVWVVSHGMDWVTGNVLAYNETFYIGSSDDFKFQAIDAASGSVDWTVSSGKNVFSKAAIANDTLYITSGDAYHDPGTGYIKALTLSGEELWTLQGSNFISSPIVSDNVIYLGSDDGYFYAVSTEQ